MARRNKFTPAARPASPVPLALSGGVLAGAALIVLATAVAYFPSLRGAFILDDKLLLTDNRLIKAADGLYRFWCTTEATDYWPVSNTTLWLEWRLWGMHPAGYHVTNLVLHIVEALLIWSILRRLSIPGAFLGALLFAVHPVNVESVAWIAQRKNLMAMLFFLLSILWYLKAETPPPSRASPPPADRWYWLSLVAFGLGMLSKGSVAILPVLLLGIVWGRRPLTRRDLIRAVPFFVVAAVLARVNVWFQTHGIITEIRTASFAERLLGAGAVVWFYLYKAMLPINLAFIYPRWHIDTEQVRWWLPLLACAGVSGVLWSYRRGWSRPLLFAWGYFCVALVPVMGFTDVGFMEHSLVADHYQHVALIAVTALVAAGWDKWQRRSRGPARWMLNALAVTVASVLTFLAWQQSGHYASALTLYRTALDKNPNSGLAHNNLGLALSESGRPQEAIEHYQQALRLKPDYPAAHNNLGVALSESGRPQEAIEHYEQALRLKPDYPEAHKNLANDLAATGRPQEAIEHYEQALRLKPDYPEAETNLGVALRNTGRLPEAIEHYEQALRLKPDYPEAETNLANGLAATGRLQEATEHYEQALRLKPDYPDAHNNLGVALRNTGRLPEAIEHFEEALQLRPDYLEAHNNLGVALRDAGRMSEAVEHYQQALRIDPDNSNAHYNLGLALSRIGRQAEAIEHFEDVLRVKPNYPEGHDSLGNALATTGRLQEAIEEYEHALRLKPDYPEAHYNLALALAKANRLPEAIQEYQQVVTLTPDYAEAWANLAFTYAAVGQSSGAISAAQKALEVARHKGQSTVVATMEKWLNSYHTDQANPPTAPPSRHGPGW